MKSYKYSQGALYPQTKRRRITGFHEDEVRPVSGSFEGQYRHKKRGEAKLDLKVDVDQVSQHSPVLNVISGSILKSKGKILSIGDKKGLYFRSIDETLVLKTTDVTAGYAREITSDVLCTRNDGEKFAGSVHILLKFAKSEGVWRGSLKIDVGEETASFECARIDKYFRQIAIDIDYVDQVVWPEVDLGKYEDVPVKVEKRKLDPKVVFEDAGVKLIYNKQDSDKITDPTPHNPWTKNDMYELMMTHLDQHSDVETLWCMMANKPPDYRYMGFSFDRSGFHGFGLFLEHKSFEGLLDESNENHSYASRKFLHYFVHECGHSLGLLHPFQLGKPNELTWMNYAWKYDHIHGPGKFYNRFTYSFSSKELEVIRHSPSREFKAIQASSVQTSTYGVVKAPPNDDKIDDDLDDEDEEEPSDVHLSLKIGIRPEPYEAVRKRSNELIEVEVRVKNEGDLPTMIEKDLSVAGGHLQLFVTYPDGKFKMSQAFSRSISASLFTDPILLEPNGRDQSRRTQVITVGEGAYGAEFDAVGKYELQAVYTVGDVKVVSNLVELQVVESDHTDVTEKSELNAAFFLGGVSHGKVGKAVEEWKRMTSLAVDKKKLLVHKIVSVAEETRGKEVRVISREGRQKTVRAQSVSLSPQDFLAGTEDLVKYYHENGSKRDSVHYKELVVARSKILLQEDPEKAEAEINQLLSDLLSRGVKHSILLSVKQEYEQLKASEDDVDRRSASYYQNRVEKILEWYPKEKYAKKKDLSGLGLQTSLSHFKDDHVAATSKIVRLLFNKLDETNDLNDVLDYADNLQRSYQVNHQVLQWAVEIFIIHSKLAKRSGIQYPLPRDKDESVESDAAMIIVRRTGEPQETWMNYWRSDADLNYHHRHWHSVYVVGRHIGWGSGWFGEWRKKRPELERQGELFAYMHQQMLARYDAERLSWGLAEVQEWKYDDEDHLGFNAGFEFHNEPMNSDVVPRPPSTWESGDRYHFAHLEDNYRNAVDRGWLPPILEGAIDAKEERVLMDFNLAGHVLEASSSTWGRSLGSLHNMGHGVFSSQRSTYMASTTTAMRDPIFYRWHKRIDNLWQYWNETQVTELAEDAPPVTIRFCDILIRREKRKIKDFVSFSSDENVSEVMTTHLGPPLKRFEWDNKKSHDPFFYHIRFRRNAPGDLNLTFRIFICPLRDINNRQMWIEMDKFVYRLPKDQDSAVIIRPDRHSSVIKRIPAEMEDDVEASNTSEVPGFCECGWPYNMLLPRGTAEGEEWRICVFVSDNNEDKIQVRSSCGSLSFCGASGQQYPDSRPMGYPFTTAVAINGKETSIPDAINALSNAAISSFMIRNNVSTEPPTSRVDLWSPFVQLGINDGTNMRSADIDLYRLSYLRGRMRVLIDDQAMRHRNLFNRISVRFQGRGNGNGCYRVTGATVAWREGTSLNIRAGTPASVLTVGGETSFEVPEVGVVTDEVEIGQGGDDLFVTFTLSSPGCRLRTKNRGNTSTWLMFNTKGDRGITENWIGLKGIRRSSAIYCIGGVMMPVAD